MLLQAVQQAVAEQGAAFDAKLEASRAAAKKDLAELEDRTHGFTTATDDRVAKLAVSAAATDSRLGELVVAQDSARAESQTQFQALMQAIVASNAAAGSLPPLPPDTHRAGGGSE